MHSKDWRSRLWTPVLREVLAVAIPAAAVVVASSGLGFPLFSALVACAFLPIRHSWPRLAMVLCLPGLAGGLGWAPGIIAMFALGRARPGRWLVGCVPIVSLAPLLPVLIQESLGSGDIVLTLSFVLLCVGAPMALGALVSTRQQLAASLARLRTATEAESFAKAETARAEERARIAREVHDAVGHHVTLMAVEAAALAATSEDPAAKESATRLRGQAKDALEEMRVTLGLTAAEHSSPASLRTIPNLVSRVRESGVDIEFFWQLDEHGEYAPGVGRAAYRVVQEALTNASKHAPGSGITVRVEDGEGTLRISVINRTPLGGAVDAGSGGSGLEGLSERLQMVGGQLTTRTGADGGFELSAVLPHSSGELV